MATGAESPRGRALHAVDTTARVAGALGRPDLAAELRAVRERLLDPAFTVLVIGEFKQGKSSLVNALLGATVCPVDDDIATAVPTVIRWSETWFAAVFLDPDGASTDPAGAAGADAIRVEVPLDRVTAYVTDLDRRAAGGADGSAEDGPAPARVRSVEVGVPSPLLQGGLVLVDTPGVGGLGSAHSAVTVGALPMADAVLFVSDASQEYSGPELDFLDTARRLCPNVIGALTKVDFYPEWRTIAELNRAHLAARATAAGTGPRYPGFPVLALSSELRRLAVEVGDGQLNAESGFTALESLLRDTVVGDGERLVLGGVRTVVERVVGELDAQYGDERAALADPELQARRTAELSAARDRAKALLAGSARWELTLADGVSDLNRDAVHDLDTRFRAFYAESDAAVDAIDPADAREEYEHWLYRRAAEHLAANDAMVRARVEDLAGRVAAHFAEDGGASGAGLDLAGGETRTPMTTVDIGSIGGAVQRVGEMRDGAPAADDKLGKGLAAMRGSYGGLMMVGVLGRLVGMAFINPVSLAIGGLLTVRTVKELRKQSLNQRRHTTKVDGQRYIGELALAARKDNVDRLERIRRQLRDRYQLRAREFTQSLEAAYARAAEDGKRSTAERTERLADLDAELARLAKLRRVVTTDFDAALDASAMAAATGP